MKCGFESIISPNKGVLIFIKIQEKSVRGGAHTPLIVALGRRQEAGEGVGGHLHLHSKFGANLNHIETPPLYPRG